MPSFGQNMPRRQREAIARVNAKIGEARLSYITAIPGQEMLYQAKEAEAVRYVAMSPEPADLSDFPLIGAEVGITAATAYELAQLWLNMSAQWRGVAAELEALRLTAVRDIEEAATAEEIATAESDLEAALAARTAPA